VDVSGSLSPEDEEIERAILRYLAAHPEAKDTLEGIAEWWLLREWTTRKYVAVERALRDLVSKDLIWESAIGQQTPSYSLNRQKLDEVMSILSKPESQ
jgi:hypothetical protein